MERMWEPPGKGPWELEATHFERPIAEFGQDAFSAGFIRGFAESTARYGVLLDHLEPGLVNGMMYSQPRAFGAPPGAMKPPPPPVLWLLTRLHPKMRARIATGRRAFADKLWRKDLVEWDEVDKPAAIAKHRAIQDVDPAGLSDDALVEHLDRCRDHMEQMVYLHHKYTITSTVTTGDFLAGAVQWTGASAGEVLGLLRGTSPISKGFAAEELDVAAKAITASDAARTWLASGGAPTDVLTALSDDPGAGVEVRAYLDAVRFRSVGYDVADPTAGEMPDLLVEALRATVAGSAASPELDARVAELRERVPSEHRDDFDDRLAEARLMNRLRDERGQYSDGWAGGLARRALLETGRRLAAAGRLHEAEHAVHLTRAECAALLAGGRGPSADEVTERHTWRMRTTCDVAPRFLRAEPPAPPPVSLLPLAARRPALAVNAILSNLFDVADEPNTETVLHGLPVNTGSYEGTARLVEDASGFSRIKRGDVLVTRMTSPYFNVVLPLLGAIVTDRGGQLCHAAIVAREYGIPGIVGTRTATRTIPDGARVRVDGSTGEVRLLK